MSVGPPELVSDSERAAQEQFDGVDAAGVGATPLPLFGRRLLADRTAMASAAFVLASVFGDATSFTVTSDARPGTRSFPSFSATVAEIADARVFGGIHFRVSCVRGNLLGQAVADYVSSHAMRPLHGD